MVRSFVPGFASLALFVSGCTHEESPQAVQTGSTGPAAASAGATREGILFHLMGRHGTPGSLWIEASYKVKREEGKLSKTLELELEDAPPGVTHTLSLDGFVLGKLRTNSEGEAEYELTAAGARSFPDGFEEPEEGSLFRVGELAEIPLLTVHRLADLQVEIAGPGKLSGKVGYKVERLGEAVTTEFRIKVVQAAAKSVHPVRIDGVHVGDLTIEPNGQGKLVYSTLHGEPFPPDFQAPRAGAKIELGTLFEGALRDNLASSE